MDRIYPIESDTNEAVDERIGLMQSFVQLDRRLDDMRMKRNALTEEIDIAEAKARELRERLGQALGFTDSAAMNAMPRKADY